MAERHPAPVAMRDGLDDVFEVLADERRRRVLRHLAGIDDGVTSVEGLADAIAEPGPAPEGRERLAIALHHAVLPRLEESGIVQYDARSRTARYQGSRRLERVLALATEAEGYQRGDAASG